MKNYVNNSVLDNQNKITAIKNRVALGIPLTFSDRALYLLFIATQTEAKEYLNSERNAKAVRL